MKKATVWLHERDEIYRFRKASPFGRGVTAGDGEGKPMAIELQTQRYAAAFVRGIVSPRSYFAVSVLALSGASRQLSQGESLTGALQNQ